MGLLTLVDRAPSDDRGVARKPFDKSSQFDYDQWTDFVLAYEPEEDLYFSAFDGDVEVARVEVVLRQLGDGYAYQQDPDRNAVIELFEVAKSYRRKGMGTAVLGLLASRLPGKTMLALSMADEFWDAQGWTRYENQEDEWSSPLYVQSCTE